MKILIIDDSNDDVKILSRHLKSANGSIEIDSADSGKAALGKLGEKDYDIAFLDIRLPDINGLELLNLISKKRHDLPVIMITGQGDEKLAVSSMKAGAYDYVSKGEISSELLSKTIINSLAKKKLEEEKERLEKELILYTRKLEEMVQERTKEIEYLNSYKEVILASLHDYIRVIDPQKKIVEYESLKIKNAFGDGVGKACYVFWNKDEACEDCISSKAVRSGTIEEKEERELNRLNRRYLVKAIPFTKMDGASAVIEVITDITEKRMLEDEIARKKKLAVMGEMAAHLAHEIRNPLHNMKIGIGLLKETLSLERQEEDVVKTMSRAVTSLEELVNDIFDFSRPHKLDWVKTDINNLIEEAVVEASTAIEGKKIEIRKECRERNIESFVDPARLKSIMKNLIINSIQAIYKEGNIKISMSTKHNDLLEIKISDNGAGISDENLEKIFEPFFTTRARGTGLGMSIVKKFLEMHDGRIDVNSRVNKGTDVIIHIPLRKEPPAS